MKKTYIVSGIFIIFFLILTVACNKVGKKEYSPEYVFTYAENHSNDYPTTMGAFEFARLVEEKTNGRIIILVEANGKLGDEESVLEQLEMGGIDFTRVSISPLSGYVKKLNVLQMPYIYESNEHMWKVLNGEIGKAFIEDMKGSGFIALSWYEAGARNFYNSKKEIHRLEDMKDLRIRVQQSELMKDMVRLLGAVAVPMSFGDVYSALETNIIDGAENNWPSYESTNHYEVSKYYTLDEHSRIPELQLCSEVTWNKLSDDDKAIILECAISSSEYEKKIWKEREELSKSKVKEAGCVITELSIREKNRFRQAMEPLYNEYCYEYMDIVKEIISMSE